MDKTKEMRSVIITLSYVFLFCFFVQLGGFPNKFAILISLFFIGIYSFCLKKITIGYREILLVTGLGIYAFTSGWKIKDAISITLLPVLLCWIGKDVSLLESSSKKNRIQMSGLVFMLVVGYFLHGFFNSIIYFRSNAAIEHGRMWGDIWGGIRLATHQNIYLLPVISLLIPACIYWKKYKAICSIEIVAGAFFLFQALHSESRIPILVGGIVAILQVFLFLQLNKKKHSFNKNIKKRIICGVCLGIVGIILLTLNINKIENVGFIQALGRDGGILHNIRFRMQFNVVKQLLKYPMGGYHAELFDLEYCHNVWLDIANASGIIPFLLLLGYMVISLLDLFKLLKNPQVMPELKYMVSGVYFALWLYYMVEPALMADVRYFTAWTYLTGVIYGYNRKLGNAS